MKIRTFGRRCVIFAVFVVLLLAMSCDSDSKDDAIEYVNQEVSYADGESCVERYLFYEEDGEYERYIAGMYFGYELPGIYFGTLFETGTYEVDTTKASQNVTFHPKKQYDFDTNSLAYLGLEGQVPYIGTLTDTELTITWEVWENYYTRSVKKDEVPIVYKRK